MKRILVLTAAVAMLALSAPLTSAFAVDATISPLCRAGAPEAYSRPGGFCAQVASNDSLADTKSAKPSCEYGAPLPVPGEGWVCPPPPVLPI